MQTATFSHAKWYFTERENGRKTYMILLSLRLQHNTYMIRICFVLHATISFGGAKRREYLTMATYTAQSSFPR